VAGINGSICIHEGGGWRNCCEKIHAMAACWLEELSVGMADGVGSRCPMGKLIAIGDKAGIMQ